MNEKIISRTSLIINILIFSFLGICLLFLPIESIQFFCLILKSLLAFTGVMQILTCILKRNNSSLLNGIFMLLFGYFIHYFQETFLSFFPIIVGLYILLHSVAKIIHFILNQKRNLKDQLVTLLWGITDAIFSLSFLLQPKGNIRNLTILLGCYFILMSSTYLYDFLRDIFPKVDIFKKQKIRFSLPVIFLTFIPYTVLTKLNKLLNQNITIVSIKDKPVSQNVDLEIFIHVKQKGNGRFGHADICFENKVYSYGNYDRSSFKLFASIGEGILFEISDKEKYLNFCMHHSKKMLFCYGITLTKEQKEKVKNQIKKLKSNTYRWYAKAEKEKHELEEFSDYPSILYDYTQAKFYKFKRSSFKIYFLLTTNCVKLVEYVANAVGMDILNINGIITPGTYYNYLESEFKRKNSNVITKTVYHEHDERDNPLPKVTLKNKS